MTSTFVIGPVKSGTTLMISLLDNHPNLSVIPLEIKFYEHYYNAIEQTPSYDRLNELFMFNSKISIIDPQGIHATDTMNSGYVNFSNVDFKKFKKSMHENVKQYKETGNQKSLLPKYIEDLHQAYTQSLGHENKQGFAIKEGCHGLPYIDAMRADFKGAKFIVMVRDPRDIFSSYKSITELKQNKRRSFGSFTGNLCLFSFLFDHPGKSILSYMDYFNTAEDDSSVLFVRYEDLVENANEEMHKVSKFLGVPFSERMLEPTNAGLSWGGNSSSGEKLNSIVGSRKNKWPKVLSEKEILIIEFFLGKYLHQNNYPMVNKNISKIKCATSVRFSHFGRPMICWKDFLRPYVRIARHISWVGMSLYLMIKRVVNS
jgi:hypothetical protein